MQRDILEALGGIHSRHQQALIVNETIAVAGLPGVTATVLTEFISGFLKDKRHMPCAVSLMVHFQTVNKLLDPELVLHRLVEEGQVHLAKAFAKQDGPDLQVTLFLLSATSYAWFASPVAASACKDCSVSEQHLEAKFCF